MATVRQINANRQNAAKSTGPVSETGKNASRQNALKHGLAGAGAVLPAEDHDAVQQRLIEWRPGYQLQTPEQEWFFTQLVVNSVRLDRCRDQEASIRLTEIRRAVLGWDDDRCAEVEEIASRLAKRPAWVVRRLQRTRQGVEWLIERWKVLGAFFEQNGEWTEAQNALALDLLGTLPEFRNDAPIKHPALVVAREVADLERRLDDALDAYDDLEREAAAKGCPIAPSKAMNNLRRYEAACRRDLHWALDQLRECRQTPAEPAQQPAPPPTPEPEPDSPSFTTPKQSQWQSGQDRAVHTHPVSDAKPESPAFARVVSATPPVGSR